MQNRLFFALDINEHDKAVIHQWRNEQLSLPYKAIALENFHITLAFLGLVNAKQQQELILKANTANQQLTNNLQFKKQGTELVLQNLGLFQKPQVLYLGLLHCPCWLTQLATSLSVAAVVEGLFQEPRPYCPHLSLYRKAKALTKPTPNFSHKLSINSFSLYQSISSSEGVQYKPLHQWQLHA